MVSPALCMSTPPWTAFGGDPMMVPDYCERNNNQFSFASSGADAQIEQRQFTDDYYDPIIATPSCPVKKKRRSSCARKKGFSLSEFFDSGYFVSFTLDLRILFLCILLWYILR